MPLPFAHQSRSKGVEADANVLFFALAFENAEAVAKIFGDGERGGPAELRFGIADAAHAGQSEGAQLSAREVVSDEIPLIIKATEMIGLHAPRFMAGAFQLFV